jgi:hypothetical protein
MFESSGRLAVEHARTASSPGRRAAARVVPLPLPAARQAPALAGRPVALAAQAIAAALILIGAALAGTVPFPATVLIATGVLLLLDLAGGLQALVAHRRGTRRQPRARARVVDLATVRRARSRR